MLDVERWALLPFIKVPGRGLEPLRISPPDPKSGASANFATLASQLSILDFGFAIANAHGACATRFVTTLKRSKIDNLILGSIEPVRCLLRLPLTSLHRSPTCRAE